VLHLESRNGVSDKLSKLLEQKSRADMALGILRNYKAPEAPSEDTVAEHNRRKTDNVGGDAYYSVDAVDAGAVSHDPVDRVLALVEERKNFQEQLSQDIKELNRIEKWGDFNPADLEALKERGVTLIPYELTRKSYDALGESSRVLVLSREKALVFCLALDGAIPGEIPFTLPNRSVTDIRQRIAEKQETLGDIEKQLVSLVSQISAIRKRREKTLEELEFESARVNMESVDAEEERGELSIVYLQGFVPQDLAGVVKRGAAENGWALLIDEPDETDNPPTLLKNNRFARLIEPLWKFFGTIPGYREYDISFSYLLTFCLFFAMIFGDAAYGSRMVGLSLILAAGDKKKSG
jgi:V/A-type H+-transporting ATPase subunit I